MDENEKLKAETINDLIKKMISVNDINYDLNSLLINISENIINGYVYYYNNKENNSYEDIILDKVVPILPQDIIFCINYSELKKDKKGKDLIEKIKESYIKNNYENLDVFLTKNEKGKEKMYIVYTFNRERALKLKDKEKYMEISSSQIKWVAQFRHVLEDYYKNDNLKKLILKYDARNAKNINFIINEINIFINNNKFK